LLSTSGLSEPAEGEGDGDCEDDEGDEDEDEDEDEEGDEDDDDGFEDDGEDERDDEDALEGEDGAGDREVPRCERDRLTGRSPQARARPRDGSVPQTDNSAQPGWPGQPRTCPDSRSERYG
jgi:hypothetical protein